MRTEAKDPIGVAAECIEAEEGEKDVSLTKFPVHCIAESALFQIFRYPVRLEL